MTGESSSPTVITPTTVPAVGVTTTINPYHLHASDASGMSQKLAGLSQGTGNPHPRINHPQHPQKFQRPNLKFKGKGAQYNPNVSCTYCGKTGHVEDNCFRLIGFSDDFQFTNDKFSWTNQRKWSNDHRRYRGKEQSLCRSGKEHSLCRS
ncbi:hypothetical protein H5410_057422 [Solanum commersonii]|uniref:CCHC-type domain-containing protein n=1 Tax=Solanum commersonii TaxID=4109 RepID=A0A9J5WQJ4_SOLCO|nr:hypothetical protein H5410_057422 [Solanum commersonii]